MLHEGFEISKKGEKVIVAAAEPYEVEIVEIRK